MSRSNYWSGKNVFITGINGFIGGNLAKRLYDQGAKIIGLVRNIQHDTFLSFEGVAEKSKLIQGDLIEVETLRRIFAEEEIQCVFHLAAQVEVGIARKYPYLTWETNVRGTYSLMEAIREHGSTVESIIVASTDKAYGSYGMDKMPYREDYPLIPTFPYDVSKACSDMIARSYASELYLLPVVITRFCNIYGPGQLNFSALIPDAVRSALGYSTFTPRGNGRQVRDFVYVGDVVSLYMMIGEALALRKREFWGQVFNAGTNEPKRVRDVLKRVFELTHQEAEFQKIETLFAQQETVGEIDCQYMNFDKVNKYFGWSPTTDFDAGLKETIDWYGRYLAASLR